MKWYLTTLAILVLLGCKQGTRNTAPAIYYWKSYFNPTSFEKQRLDSLQVNCLYIKFFDIAWDDLAHKALPVAKIRIRDTSYLQQKTIVPTVFITNDVFYKLDSAEVKALASNTASLLKKYSALYHIDPINEVQMDCDWTATTKDKYFYFLENIKAQNIAPVVSATIRLHQVKYTTSSGIPPAHKGLLMCYNMGNLQDIKSRNSIIDVETFKAYQSFIQTYPLQLDIGLPLFDWYVLFRKNKYTGLFLSIPAPVVNSFKNSGSYHFEVLKDTVISGRPLKTGDVLRYEKSDAGTVQNVVRLLNKKLTAKSLHVVLYHCDSVILNKYSLDELESFYSGLLRY
ncbi:MAG: hypothetical protein QM594_12940 [Niabella sp.]